MDTKTVSTISDFVKDKDADNGGVQKEHDGTLRYVTPSNIETFAKASSEQQKTQEQAQTIEAFTNNEKLKAPETPKPPEVSTIAPQQNSDAPTKAPEPITHIVDKTTNHKELEDVSPTASELTVLADRIEEEFIHGVEKEHAQQQ